MMEIKKESLRLWLILKLHYFLDEPFYFLVTWELEQLRCLEPHKIREAGQFGQFKAFGLVFQIQASLVFHHILLEANFTFTGLFPNFFQQLRSKIEHLTIFLPKTDEKMWEWRSSRGTSILLRMSAFVFLYLSKAVR